MRKIIFIDSADHLENSEFTKYLDLFDLVLIPYEEKDNISLPEKEILYLKENSIVNSQGNHIGKKLIINTPEDMTLVLEAQIIKDEYLLVETGSWHIIPIENLIAKFEGSNTKLIAFASTVTEFKLLEGILEKGVYGAILPVDLELIKTIHESESEGFNYDLVELSVKSIKKIRHGERVCVDTCSSMRPGEGMLIGATSSMFVLVEGEVHDSGFVNARPFRVNAGVISSYFLNGEKTGYLSELEAGKDVVIIDRAGNTRIECVARVKIERRPFVLIKMAAGENEYPVILQDAETVRLVTSDGSISVTELVAGDTIIGFLSSSGRHFGMKVDEFLEER